MTSKPVAAGKSSFDLIDSAKALSVIDLKPGSSFADLACGIGRYSIAIAEKFGKTVSVVAIDLWPEGIEALRREIDQKNIANIKPVLADIRNKLPLANNSLDSCLLATVLHDLAKSDREATIQEISRILRPGGMLNIIEFKKINIGPGPPLNIRMDEAEVTALVTQHGYDKITTRAIGEFNYLMRFKRREY